MAKHRTFAADTSVPVDRTRNEIRALLEAWGCSAMGWTDHFADAAVELGFVWDPAIIDRFGKKPTNCPGGYEHRWAMTCVPCKWKAAQAGLAKAEEVFMPWIVDGNGNTVSDVILPRIRSGWLALPAKAGGDT